MDLRERHGEDVQVHGLDVRSAEESVSGMRRVLDGLTMKESGGFFHFDGERLPW